MPSYVKSSDGSLSSASVEVVMQIAESVFVGIVKDATTIVRGHGGESKLL